LIVLFFLSLANPEEANARVAERFDQGGHTVPKEVILRRYYNSGDVLDILDEGSN